MKNMNYLKPDIKTCFLNNGSRSEVTYLQIPNDMSLSKLYEDVYAGAKQFLPVYELLSKNPSRIILIDCDTKEEGLMAATYLAGVLNHKKEEEVQSATDELKSQNKTIDENDCFLDDSEDLLYENEEDLPDYNYEEPIEECDDEDDFLLTDTPIYKHNLWTERRERLPIIPIEEMREFFFPGQNTFFGTHERYSFRPRKVDYPYWTNCTSKSICILANYVYESDVDLLKHFPKNEHIFIVRIKTMENMGPFPWMAMNFDDDNDNDDEEDDKKEIDNFRYELLLEYAADVLTITLSEEDKNVYYDSLLKNWAKRYHFSFEPGFPYENLVNEILKMNRNNKSHMIDRLMNSIAKKKERDEKSMILSKNDFVDFEIFRYMLKTKHSKIPASEKLEKELIGMDSVKKQVHQIIEVMKFNQRRKELGLPNEAFHNIHVLLGAPGTAKTTVAKLMGTIMMEENLLPNNRFICINGAELKGMYVGHSAPKTKQIFNKYDVIMIDEAYSLTSDDGRGNDSFSQEALAQLMIELEKHGTDKLIMFAGYGGKDVSNEDNRMSTFINSNPGLKSRINSTIVFPSYSSKEMVNIVHKQAEILHFNIDNKADDLLLSYFNTRVKEKNFGNGREARSLLENCERYIAERVMKLPKSKQTKKACSTILYEDVKKAISKLESDNRAQTGSTKRLGFI